MFYVNILLIYITYVGKEARDTQFSGICLKFPFVGEDMHINCYRQRISSMENYTRNTERIVFLKFC